VGGLQIITLYTTVRFRVCFQPAQPASSLHSLREARVPRADAILAGRVSRRLDPRLVAHMGLPATKKDVAACEFRGAIPLPRGVTRDGRIVETPDPGMAVSQYDPKVHSPVAEAGCRRAPWDARSHLARPGMGEAPLKFGLLAAAVCLTLLSWAPAIGARADEPPAAQSAPQTPAETEGVAEEPADFRVVNEVYLGLQRKPVSRSVTIFHDGVVYDFLLSEPQEVVVFDPAAERLVLLDLQRRIRTQLSTAEVEEFSQRLKQWASQQRDPLLRFLSAPDFSEQFDEVRGELTLSSPWLTYRILLANAPSPSVCRQYREFSDWMARLNTLLRANARLPFARLMVNQAVAQRRAVPREVTLSLARSSLPLPRRVVRSEHQFYSQVMGPDLDRVLQAQQFMDIFKPVDFREYRRTDED